MADKECGICRGLKVIRLADLSDAPPLTFGRVEMAPAMAAFTLREFPCPGCSDLPPERIELVEETVEIDGLLFAQSVIDVIAAEKRMLVRMLAEKLMEKGLVSFDQETVDSNNIRLRAFIGVATKPDLARLVDLIDRHREPVAMRLVAELMDEVNNWGSGYGEHSIEKSKVSEFARNAVRRVLEWRRRPA